MRLRGVSPVVSMTALVASLANATLPTLARSETAEMEEVVVTARKRAEAAQSVPISLTALSGEALEQRSVRSLADVAQFTPNLTFDVGAGSAGGTSGSSIYIRGIGKTEFNGVYEPGVGIYVDGVYFSRTVGSVLDVIDLEHIEVLRGPQGTLFGKNTVGGAINLVANLPSGKLGGFTELTVGSLDQFDVAGVIEFPIVEDELAARVSLTSRNRDGYARSRITGQDQNDVDDLSGRGVLRWTPNSAVALTFIADWTRQRRNGQAQHLVAFTPGNALPGIFSSTVASTTPYQAFDSRWLSAEEDYNYANGPSVNDVDLWGVSGTLEWELNPSLALTSITAYRRSDTHVGVDVDGTPLDYQATDLFDIQYQFSQELRLGGTAFGERMDWLAGIYYFNEEVHDVIWLRALPGLFNLALDQDIYLTNKSFAGFGQVTFDLTNKLSLTGGARYNYETKDAALESVNNSATVIPPGSTLSPTWRSWTPKLSVEYQISRQSLLYASWSEGFKSGAVNYEVQRPADYQVFDPEEVTTYEVGFKADLLGDHLRVNGAVFYSDYTDMQLKAVVAPGQYTCPPTVTTFCSLVVNAAQVDIAGAELDIVARPAAGLNFNAGVGYVDDEFKRIDPALLSVINYDTQIPKTPTWTVSTGAQYTFPLAGLGIMSLRGDYSYRSKTFTEIRNSTAVAQDEYGLLNARVSLVSPKERWEFSLSGLNLTDEKYISSGVFLATGISTAAYGIPRTWSFSMRYRFGDH